MKHHISLVLAILGLATTGLSALGRAEGSIQTTWDQPEGILTVVVDADRQDLVVKAGGPRVTGRLIGDSGDGAKVVRDGASLTLTVRSTRTWFSLGGRSARVELSVPPGTTLDLTTASGAILVRVPSGALKARSGSGDIEAALGTGTVDASTDSGTVRLKGFSGTIQAAALSGDVDLEDIAGTIAASTMSGSLRGTGLAPGDGSRFTTVSGDADLQFLGGPVAYSLRAETVSGSVWVGDQKSDSSPPPGSKGPAVVVTAVSGDIRIR